MLRHVGGRTVNTTTLSNLLKGMGWKKLEDTLKWRGKTRRVYYLPGVWCDGAQGDALRELVRARLVETEVHDEDAGRQYAADW